jgi:lipopolysaccharide/colanic/teichoic acid biosynthesis glycosyltransferase
MFAACTGLLALSPLIIFIALAIRLRLGRPVVFRQQRPGHNGRPFYVYKFRTMMRSTHADGRPMSDDERMGRLGRLLRRTSLDELPQLLNVLQGEMSLVGPRPLLMEYLDLYTPEQMRRHDVRPGITGLAQVSGRNNLPWEDRFELDVWYVDHWSLLLDFKILLLSIQKVFRGEGVSARGVATMTKFAGSPEDGA